MGDLGDHDGLEAHYEQRMIAARNTAALLADFHDTLLKKGLTENVAYELVQMHYAALLAEEAMVDDFVFQSFDDDDE